MAVAVLRSKVSSLNAQSCLVHARVVQPMQVFRVPLTVASLQDDVYGWDFVSNDNSVFDGTGDDHGT